MECLTGGFWSLAKQPAGCLGTWWMLARSLIQWRPWIRTKPRKNGWWFDDGDIQIRPPALQSTAKQLCAVQPWIAQSQRNTAWHGAAAHHFWASDGWTAKPPPELVSFTAGLMRLTVTYCDLLWLVRACLRKTFHRKSLHRKFSARCVQRMCLGTPFQEPRCSESAQ